MQKHNVAGQSPATEEPAANASTRLETLMTELLASVHGGGAPPYRCDKTGNCRPQEPGDPCAQ